MSSGGYFPNVLRAAKSEEQERRRCTCKLRHILLGIAMIGVVLGVTLGLGLGVGLTRYVVHRRLASSHERTVTSATFMSTLYERSSKSANATTAAAVTWWTPVSGISWQIQIAHPLTESDTKANVSVYDIDLFLNNATIITKLHAENRKVICYFSAGSYEDFRPDAAEFLSSDYGSPRVGWPGEWWLNTNSTNVRNIMLNRLDVAVAKDCDGVDPDNIDGFKNANGLNLTQGDAISYIAFLSEAAHARNLSMGLKNGGDIIKEVGDKVEYAVNEQCVKYRECEIYQPLITTNKPVFHIEYESNYTPNATAIADAMMMLCYHKQAANFSTILKHLSLSDWYAAC